MASSYRALTEMRITRLEERLAAAEARICDLETRPTREQVAELRLQISNLQRAHTFVHERNRELEDEIAWVDPETGITMSRESTLGR